MLNLLLCNIPALDRQESSLTIADLSQHLKIILGPHFQPLGFEELVLLNYARAGGASRAKRQYLVIFVTAETKSSALRVAAEMIADGERSAEAVSLAMQEVFDALPSINLEYIAICDNIYLRPIRELRGEFLIAVAARVGKARLIDNMLFEVE